MACVSNTSNTWFVELTENIIKHGGDDTIGLLKSLNHIVSAQQTWNSDHSTKKTNSRTAAFAKFAEMEDSGSDTEIAVEKSKKRGRPAKVRTPEQLVAIEKKKQAKEKKPIKFRPSPTELANKFDVGTVETGIDGKPWVVVTYERKGVSIKKWRRMRESVSETKAEIREAIESSMSSESESENELLASKETKAVQKKPKAMRKAPVEKANTLDTGTERVHNGATWIVADRKMKNSEVTTKYWKKVTLKKEFDAAAALIDLSK